MLRRATTSAYRPTQWSTAAAGSSAISTSLPQTPLAAARRLERITTTTMQRGESPFVVRGLATASVAGENAKKQEWVTRLDHQPHLPQLPVPELDTTLRKYLDNVKLFLSPEEFERTRTAVQQFQKNDRSVESLVSPVELQFDLSPEIKKYIKNAEARLAQNAKDVDLQVLYFEHFGKETMKKWGVSPDAFCQMAMQLAVYSLTGQLYPTYESGATRAFLWGRTETVRSVSAESVAWLKAMTSRDVSDQEKFQLLLKAADRHTNTNKDACAGQGIDRHLLGLKLIAAEAGMQTPAIYTDPAYSKTCTWKLSTSQLSSPYFQVVFGPVAEDGIGCCYGIKDNGLHFKASVAPKSPVNATQFCSAVEASLLDMAKLCRANAPNKSSAKL